MKPVEVWKTFKAKANSRAQVEYQIREVVIQLFGDRWLKNLKADGKSEYTLEVKVNDMTERYGFAFNWIEESRDDSLTIFVYKIR